MVAPRLVKRFNQVKSLMLGHIQNLDNLDHLNNGHFCSKRECTYLKSISEDMIGCLKRKK